MRASLAAAIAALPLARAVFQDEVGRIDFHHALLGAPQAATTFFHRPRLEDKASLLYALGDVGILGAVNPSNGDFVWRQELSTNVSAGAGRLRAGHGESWLVAALGSSIHAWNALSGRNIWWLDVAGEVRDLEILELTGSGRKDVLALSHHDGVTRLRRLAATDGAVEWELTQTNKDIPLQVSTDSAKVFLVSLHGSPASYSLQVSVFDALDGRRLDDVTVGARGDVHGEQHVIFVGANSAAPIVAWTDEALTKLRVNVLGTKQKQEFPLAEGTTHVEIHAPHLVQSSPHFLVHSRTVTGNQAEVYHVDLKTNAIKKAYDLPHLPGRGAFSTSSSGANVYFTRITNDDIILTDSLSHGILGQWPLKAGEHNGAAVHAVSEVIKKAGDSFAVRSAAVTELADWILIKNGDLGWVRPEGLSGAIAGVFAELPESETLAKALEQEAHENPWSAYIHRVKRHLDDLRHLPSYFESLPKRLINSIAGTEIFHTGDLERDSFGFHKIIVLATRRGRLSGLDAANHGRVLWSRQAFPATPADPWVVKGIFVDEARGHVTVRGAHGEYITVKSDTGEQVELVPRGSGPELDSTALVDSPSGPWLLPIGKGGSVGDVPAAKTPKQTVVVRGEKGELKGLKFTQKGAESVEQVTWIFSPPLGHRIVSIAARPPHEPIASIGRVLGDRRVLYKYLHPNTIVVATVDDAASVLTVNLLDTVSGQILSSASHEGVDAAKGVECAISENWFVCTFFGEYTLRDGGEQSIKGYQLVVSDLYESDQPDDRGPLGGAANYSSLGAVDDPTAGGAPFPAVVSQAFVVAAPLTALAVTQTRQGVTSRQLLAYLPHAHSVAGLPRVVLEPRRPVGRDPTPAEAEEGLFRYHAAVEIDPKAVVSHERDVIGVAALLTAPTHVESTTLVAAYGVDVFGSRLAPSFAFDILGRSFGKLSMLGTVLALFAGVVVLGPMVRTLFPSPPFYASTDPFTC